MDMVPFSPRSKSIVRVYLPVQTRFLIRPQLLTRS
jgi:hypothetical protein